jgi:hypothetical protein
MEPRKILFITAADTFVLPVCSIVAIVYPVFFVLVH